MAKTTANSWTRTNYVIGKGSFGTVTAGIRNSDGGIFAVKSVKQSVEFRREVECLESEIRILRSLNSPYVVGFLGDDVSGDSPPCRNLHMEYLPGGTVAHHPTGAGDEKILQARTRCIVSALGYVHSRGIVHCDVKGRNILIGMDRNLVKLADFGSAISDAGTTCGGSVVARGSPLWMAPEVVRGEYQGPESDVWSVGCTVIEMFTGKPAWEDFGADTVSRIGFSDEVPDFPGELSEIGRDFLRKCLGRDRSERWSCDRLLQHPFLAATESPEIAGGNSPRCVLDWVDHGDEEISFSGENPCVGCRESEISGEGRIGKLSTSEWPEWESDGWSPVRSYGCELSPTPATCEEGVGVSWDYGNLRGVEREMEGTSLEYSDGKFGAEYSNFDVLEIPALPRNHPGSGARNGSGGLCFRRRSRICEITAIASWICSIELIFLQNIIKTIGVIWELTFFCAFEIFSSFYFKKLSKNFEKLTEVINTKIWLKRYLILIHGEEPN